MRPEHLNCVNTPDGIRHINAEQERYDRDPEAYERQAQYEAEMQAQQAQWEAEQQAMAQAQWGEKQAIQKQYYHGDLCEICGCPFEDEGYGVPRSCCDEKHYNFDPNT